MCHSHTQRFGISLGVAFVVMLVAAVLAHAASHHLGAPALGAVQVAQVVAVALTGAVVHAGTGKLLRG